MTQTQTLLRAHSTTEVQFYFLLTPCPGCGKSALRNQGDIHAPDAHHPEPHLHAACGACYRPFPALIVIDPPPQADAPPLAVNTTNRPSELIDLPGWITLYRVLLESAWNEPDKKVARRLNFEAGLCLDEALRFYPPNENMPLRTAFFTPASAERFRQARDQFDRRLVLHHRSKLPRLTDSERSAIVADASAGRPWWKFWQRRTRPRMPE